MPPVFSVHGTCHQLSIATLPISIQTNVISIQTNVISIQTNVGVVREVYVIVIVTIVLSRSDQHYHHHFSYHITIVMIHINITIIIIDINITSIIRDINMILTILTVFNFQETGGWYNAWVVCTRAKVSSIESFPPTRGSTPRMNMPGSSGIKTTQTGQCNGDGRLIMVMLGHFYWSTRGFHLTLSSEYADAFSSIAFWYAGLEHGIQIS